MADDTDYAGLAGSIFGKSTGFLNDALSRGAGDMARSRDMEGQALQGGLSYFQNWDQNHPTNLPLLMGAGAMLGPTKTGSFSESLGNAFTAGGGALQQAQRAEMERQEKMMRIQMAQSALARKPYEDSLGLAKTGFGGLGEMSTGAGTVSDFQFLNSLKGGGKRADAGDPAAVGGPQVAEAAPAPDAAASPDLTAVAAAPAVPAPAAAATPAAPAESKVALDPDLPAPGAVPAGGAPFTTSDPHAGATPGSVAKPDAPMLPGEGSVGIQQAQRIVQMYNADPSKFRGPQAQKYLEAARKIIAESPEQKGLIKGYEKAQETPYDIQKSNAEKFYTENASAKKEAAVEATKGIQALNNAKAIRQLWVNPKTGEFNVNGGPSGDALGNLAQRMQQMGPTWGKIGEMITGTNPNDIAAMNKLQTAIGSEIASMEMAGAPVRVGEFNRFMNSSPGANVPGKAALWVLDNVIIPKSQSQIERYKAISGHDIGKTDIRDKLFEYDTQNPWFTPGANPDQTPDKQPTQAKAAAAAVPPAPAREVGKVYPTPKGNFRWMGNGWQKAD